MGYVCIKDVPDEIKVYFKYKHELAVQELIFKSGRILIPHSLRRLMIDQVHASRSAIERNIINLTKKYILTRNKRSN